MRFKWYSVLLSILTVVGCYNSFDAQITIDDSVEDASYTIAALHSLYDYQAKRLFNEECSVRGVVTANDIGGNLYGSFIIEDGGYAVEILDGLSASYVRHVEGATVLINLEGLAMSRSRGVLQIGLPADDYSYSTLSYLSSLPIIEEHIKLEGYGTVVEVPSYTAEWLSVGMCGRVIEFSGLTPLIDEEQSEAIIRWSGYRAFTSDYGQVIYSYVSSYASFAYEPLEGGEHSITAVVQWDSVEGEQTFVLKPRKWDDIKSN